MIREVIFEDAIAKSIHGKEVFVAIPQSVDVLTLAELKNLREAGAVFYTKVPAVENDLGIQFPTKKQTGPAIWIESMEDAPVEQSPPP